MTNLEAIKILDNLKPGDYSNPYEKGEAIVMAISALQAQANESKTRNSFFTESGNESKERDFILRQAAIDALCSECQGRCIPCDSYPCSEVEAINALPSAQPYKAESEEV